MATETELEKLEKQFEVLVPLSVKDLGPYHPDRVTYDDLKVYSKEQVEALFEPWNLVTTNAKNRLIRLWEDHPNRIKVQQGK